MSAVKDDGRTAVPGYLDFAVSVMSVDGVATVRVVGDLDCHTAPRLRSALVALVADGVREVTVDMSGTSFLDSTGLSVLVGGLKRLREHGGDMVVKSPTSAARKLFELTGLDTVFSIA
jgi:anti-sigma B factor antagonist